MKNELVTDLCIIEPQVTLILESPHREEVKHGIPLAGESGHIVSKGLLPGVDIAAGVYIKKNGGPFSVINTFQYALQFSECMEDLCSAIGKLCYNTLGPRKYKDALKVVFSQSPSVDESKKSYIKRLRYISTNSEDDLKIIICGFIAQAFFEFTLDMQSLPFGEVVKCKVFERNTRILYVEHPSPKNSGTFWAVNTDKNKIMRTFAQCS